MPVDIRTQGEDALLTPANVGTTSPGPEAVDTSIPPTVSEPQPATDEAPEQSGERAEEQEPAPEPLPEFDPQYRLAFEGLAYLGRLTRKFEFIGHTFVIKTMSVDETLAIGLLSQPYVGTMTEMKAYQAAVVAGCLVSVDNRPLPIPITDAATDTEIRNRFDYVRDHWFMPVLDKIYQEYLLLEFQVAEVITALGEASG